MVDVVGHAALEALVEGRFHDPFAVLGVHHERGCRVLRVWWPGAMAVELLDRHGQTRASLRQVHSAGVFTAEMPANLRHYRLRVQSGDGSWSEHEDAYRFPSTLGELDLYLLGEGAHRQIYRKLGAQSAACRACRHRVSPSGRRMRSASA